MDSRFKSQLCVTMPESLLPQVMEPGFGIYHRTGIVVPLALAIFAPIAIVSRIPSKSPVVRALVSGVLVALISYVALGFIDPMNRLEKCAILGLLVAEFAIFGTSKKIPSMLNIAFFTTCYLFALTHHHEIRMPHTD